MADSSVLVARLLAGPDDVRLTDEELALLEALLANRRRRFKFQEFRDGVAERWEAEGRKLKTILDYNRKIGNAHKRWVWDLYPLAKDSWGNCKWSDDGTPAGQIIVISHTRTRFVVTACDGGEDHVNRTVSRRFYIPTSDDLELLRALYPHDDPFQPAWYVIKADLVAANHDADKLDQSEATVLLKLLGKATQSTSQQSTGVNVTRSPRSRGRKKANYETVQYEASVAADWTRARDAGTYKGDFARDNNMSVKDLDRLLGRVDKRKKPSE